MTTVTKPTRRRATTSATQTFEFIALDQHGRPPSDRRKFIRSYVMRGKNTEKRTGRGADGSVKRSAKDATKEDVNPGGSTAPIASRPLAAHVCAACDDGTSTSCLNHAFDNQVGREADPAPVPGPVALSSDLRLIPFVKDTDDISRNLLHRFVTTIKETMYPIEVCSDFDVSNLRWFEWLLQDASYFHATLFCVGAIEDIMVGIRSGKRVVLQGNQSNLGDCFSPRTRQHLRWAIASVQHKIQDRELQLQDTTLATVMTLAMVADSIGDGVAYDAHVEGLAQMVRMKGGIKAFANNRQLQTKIGRVDIGWSLKTGSKPRMFAGGVSWKPIFDAVDTPRWLPAANILQTLEADLLAVFVDVREFSRMINGLVVARQRIAANHFQDVMLSTQYRLMHLGYSPEHEPVQEAVRVGLLAFQASVFVQTPYVKMRTPFLADHLRRAIKSLSVVAPAAVDLRLWLLMLASIAVFGPGDLCLMEGIAELTAGDGEWEQVRGRMQDIMWVDIVHDVPGRYIYQLARERGGLVIHDV